MFKKNGQNLYVPKDMIMQAVPEKVRCTFKPECKGCPYPRHGFICYNSRDGTCLKDWMKDTRQRRNDHAGS